MRVSSILALAAVPLVVGCGTRRIPGTEIKDNRDTRAIYSVIEQYHGAAEKRDAAAVMALVSKQYFDDAGTPDPGDDVDYGQLRKRISEDYSKLTAVRLDIQVRGIDVDDDHAAAYIYYEEHYRIATRAGEVPKQASDVHRMRFVREDGAWKFASGL
jgi:ketosteroid isomerase-like protein